jgi:hypothetical protein
VIWSGHLKDLPLVQEDTEIKISYTYDTNGIMQCSIIDLLSGKEVTVKLEKKAASADKPGSGVNIKDYTLE